MNRTWYQNSVVYALDIETFYDSNDDGTGDFQGLIQKLGYLAGIGINCIWLLPFYPSPNRDNGYDVRDYYNIDPKLGTLGDFAEFMNRAEQFGIRVIIDLVVNHTSNKHPWFLEARRNKNSKYRDYYVWADKPLAFEKEHLMFTGEEETIWTYDDAAGQYYLHRFYKEQPDLNIGNPAVRAEILRIMGFWLQMGVSGFRIDAAEILIEPYAMKPREKKEVERILDEMRDHINARKSDAILLAETNIGPDQIAVYLQKGQRMHLLFNFFVNQHLYLSLAEGSAGPLSKALERLPQAHANQWLQFLRHHDELSLKLLTDRQREKIFTRFAPEEHMRIFGKGIRRRLAPMLGGHRSMLRMLFSLLFSLPGIPLIRYGDEIGMGDDLGLPGRDSVRTPMQWTARKNGGFSDAAPGRLPYPLIKGEYGYEQVNVMDALADPDSLLNWMKRLISVRRLCQEIIEGPMELIQTGHKNIMGHMYRADRLQLLLLHNLSDTIALVEIKSLGLISDQLFDLLTDEPTAGDASHIAMNAYGYKWIKILL